MCMDFINDNFKFIYPVYEQLRTDTTREIILKESL